MTALSILLFMSQGWTVTPEEELERIARAVALEYSEYQGGSTDIDVCWDRGGYFVSMAFEFKGEAVDCDVACKLARDFNIAIWRSKPRISQACVWLFYYIGKERRVKGTVVRREKVILDLYVGRLAAMKDFRMWVDPQRKPTVREFIRWVSENRRMDYTGNDPRNNTGLNGLCIK